MPEQLRLFEVEDVPAPYGVLDAISEWADHYELMGLESEASFLRQIATIIKLLEQRIVELQRC